MAFALERQRKFFHKGCVNYSQLSTGCVERDFLPEFSTGKFFTFHKTCWKLFDKKNLTSFSCSGKKRNKRIRHRRGVNAALPRVKYTLSYVPLPCASPYLPEELNLDSEQSKNVPIFALLRSAEHNQTDLFSTSGEAAGVSKGGRYWRGGPLWLSSLVTFLCNNKKVTIHYGNYGFPLVTYEIMC